MLTYDRVVFNDIVSGEESIVIIEIRQYERFRTFMRASDASLAVSYSALESPDPNNNDHWWDDEAGSLTGKSFLDNSGKGKWMRLSPTITSGTLHVQCYGRGNI